MKFAYYYSDKEIDLFIKFNIDLSILNNPSLVPVLVYSQLLPYLAVRNYDSIDKNAFKSLKKCIIELEKPIGTGIKRETTEWDDLIQI